MPQIVVARPFTLTLSADDVRHFASGIHADVALDVAEHWFTKLHLAQDGRPPEPAVTAPLTNEERTSVKASIDAAEKRAMDAEAEAKSARGERDASRSGMDKLVADNEALRSRIASLEADFDKATKPVAITPATSSKLAAK